MSARIRWLIAVAVLSGLALIAAAAPGQAPAAPSPELSVMSFNIRTLMLSDGLDYWAFRKDHVADLVRKYGPDLAGMQEVFKSQANDLARRLPEYAWFGPPREDGKRVGERCPIFYRRDRLELEEQGTFWLSKTPDVAGSRSWDAAFPRLVTWGRFKHKTSGVVFYLFNTHFDHMGETAREMSAKILVERAGKIAGARPVIITGDFNASPDSVPYQTMAAAFRDARAVSASAPEGPEATTRDFKRDSIPERRIDYVFVSAAVSVSAYATIADTYDSGRRPSDHMPVMATMRLP